MYFRDSHTSSEMDWRRGATLPFRMRSLFCENPACCKPASNHCLHLLHVIINSAINHSVWGILARDPSFKFAAGIDIMQCAARFGSFMHYGTT